MKKMKIMSMKTILPLGLSVLALLFIIGGCNLFTNDSGRVSLALTDAPADGEDVEGVFITIASIQYHINDEWVEADEFEEPQEFNLLELTGGEVAPLGDTVLPAGQVDQIRFMLDAPEDGENADGQTAGSYIVIDPSGTADGIDDGDDYYPLFVPSGEQTGYKAVGSFVVPQNGPTVEITADFDVRKSVVETGNGIHEYLLKPTIRLIVNDQAGSIEGAFIENTADAYDEYVVFAYEEEVYDAEEVNSVPQFENAVTSSAVDDNDEYILPFLAEGTYDLIVAGVNADGDYDVVNAADYLGIEVTSNDNTSQNIDISE